MSLLIAVSIIQPLPCSHTGHVHAGNVMVDSAGNCRLTELENALLGLPSIYRRYMVQTRKIRSTELQAVYSFGHLLYELSAGQPLGAAFMDAPPPSASAKLRKSCGVRVEAILEDGVMFLMLAVADRGAIWWRDLDRGEVSIRVVNPFLIHFCRRSVEYASLTRED